MDAFISLALVGQDMSVVTAHKYLADMDQVDICLLVPEGIWVIH